MRQLALKTLELCNRPLKVSSTLVAWHIFNVQTFRMSAKPGWSKGELEKEDFITPPQPRQQQQQQQQQLLASSIWVQKKIAKISSATLMGTKLYNICIHVEQKLCSYRLIPRNKNATHLMLPFWIFHEFQQRLRNLCCQHHWVYEISDRMYVVNDDRIQAFTGLLQKQNCNCSPNAANDELA